MLESRIQLSAIVTSLGQDGTDLVGPDAAQGSDGIQDLHLQLSGLSDPVAEISVKAPGGFAWATQPDPSGFAMAEYFASSTAGTGDLYINPQVRSTAGVNGATLPLGGSTGSLIQLTNGTTLTVAITYQGQSAPTTTSVTLNNLVSATDPRGGYTDARERCRDFPDHR